MEIARIREDITEVELRRLVRSRSPFRNSRGSFRGVRLSQLDISRVATDVRVRNILTANTVLALVLDEPDYLIFSGMAPIVWHSTTRGIKHRSQSQGDERREWVAAGLKIWPNRVTEKRYNRLVGIIRGLE